MNELKTRQNLFIQFCRKTTLWQTNKNEYTCYFLKKLRNFYILSRLTLLDFSLRTTFPKTLI